MFDNYDERLLNKPQLFDTESYEETASNKKIDEVRDFVEGILETVYLTGDVEILEHCLTELCGILEIENTYTEVKLERKDKNRMMHWYLGYQRATMDQMGDKND